jgi:hypothetical protein
MNRLLHTDINAPEAGQRLTITYLRKFFLNKDVQIQDMVKPYARIQSSRVFGEISSLEEFPGGTPIRTVSYTFHFKPQWIKTYQIHENYRSDALASFGATMGTWLAMNVVPDQKLQFKMKQHKSLARQFNDGNPIPFFAAITLHDDTPSAHVHRIYVKAVRMDKQESAVNLWRTIYEKCKERVPQSSQDAFRLTAITLVMIPIPRGGCGNKLSSADKHFSMTTINGLQWINPRSVKDGCLLSCLFFSLDTMKINWPVAAEPGDRNAFQKQSNAVRQILHIPPGPIECSYAMMTHLAMQVHANLSVYMVEDGQFVLVVTAIAPHATRNILLLFHENHYYLSPNKSPLQGGTCTFCHCQYVGLNHTCPEDAPTHCGSCGEPFSKKKRHECNPNTVSFRKRHGIKSEKNSTNALIKIMPNGWMSANKVEFSGPNMVHYDIETWQSDDQTEFSQTDMIVSDAYRDGLRTFRGDDPWREFFKYLETIPAQEFDSGTKDKKGKPIKYTIRTLLNAYNGARFDHHFLMRYLNKSAKALGWTIGLNMAPCNGRILNYSFSKDHAKFKTWDLCQFMASSLDKACRSLGVAVSKGDFPHDLIKTRQDYHTPVKFEVFNDPKYYKRKTPAYYEDWKEPLGPFTREELEEQGLLLPGDLVDIKKLSQLYCQNDVVCLREATETFCSRMTAEFKIDPRHFITGRAWGCQIWYNSVPAHIKPLITCPESKEQEDRQRSMGQGGRCYTSVKKQEIPELNTLEKVKEFLSTNNIDPSKVYSEMKFRPNIGELREETLLNHANCELDFSSMYASIMAFGDFCMGPEIALTAEEVEKCNIMSRQNYRTETKLQDRSWCKNRSFKCIIKPNRWILESPFRRRDAQGLLSDILPINEPVHIFGTLVDLLIQLHCEVEILGGWQYQAIDNPFKHAIMHNDMKKMDFKRLAKKWEQEHPGEPNPYPLMEAIYKFLNNGAIYGSQLMRAHRSETIVTDNEEEIKKFILKHPSWTAGRAIGGQTLLTGDKTEYVSQVPVLFGIQILCYAQILYFTYIGLLHPDIYTLPEVMEKEAWRYAKMVRDQEAYRDTDSLHQTKKFVEELCKVPASAHPFYENMKATPDFKFDETTMVQSALGFMKREYEDSDHGMKVWARFYGAKDYAFLAIFKNRENTWEMRFEAKRCGITKKDITLQDVLEREESNVLRQQRMQFQKAGLSKFGDPEDQFSIKRVKRTVEAQAQGNRSRTWVDVSALEGKSDEELAGMIKTKEDLHKFIVVDRQGNHSIPNGSIMLELPENIKKVDQEREANWLAKAYERGIKDFETLLDWPECFHNEPCKLYGGSYICKFSNSSACAFKQAYFTLKEEEEQEEEEEEEVLDLFEESVESEEDIEC